MPTYKIVETQTVYKTYIIEAPNADEARKIYDDGYAKPVSTKIEDGETEIIKERK